MAQYSNATLPDPTTWYKDWPGAEYPDRATLRDFLKLAQLNGPLQTLLFAAPLAAVVQYCDPTMENIKNWIGVHPTPDPGRPEHVPNEEVLRMVIARLETSGNDWCSGLQEPPPGKHPKNP